MSEKVCVDPSAPEVPCCICGNMVKTCSSDEPVDGPDGCDFTCPVHADGCELSDGRWVCSEKCWDKSVEQSEHTYSGVNMLLTLAYILLVVGSFLAIPFVESDWMKFGFILAFFISVYGFFHAIPKSSDSYQDHQAEADGKLSVRKNRL